MMSLLYLVLLALWIAVLTYMFVKPILSKNDDADIKNVERRLHRAYEERRKLSEGHPRTIRLDTIIEILEIELLAAVEKRSGARIRELERDI